MCKITKKDTQNHILCAMTVDEGQFRIVLKLDLINAFIFKQFPRRVRRQSKLPPNVWM